MQKILQFLESLFFVVFLFGAFYLIYNEESITILYDLPDYFLLTISVLILIYTGYRYFKLSFKASKLEYEFTSIVNHTFRTPLTRIMWIMKELEKDIPDKEKLLHLQNMSNATNKILEIVDLFAGIKNINDTSSYYFEAISIRDIVEKSINKYREEINKKNISFEVPTFKDAPLLTLDVKKISFVIDALIENAILYTPKDGKISMNYISTHRHIVLFIQDTGMGFSIADRFRIFSRFYRNNRAKLKNPDGMGLKLYLSRQIIHRHKGEIYAKSWGKNRGAKFFVELPFHK
ncbi:MAG: Periplasmic sensor signal transduction histidine kinase [Candidatus Nomurabacteria bacterium GW2011_GWA2_40_9]|uniref:histidine kinase n=1 Tax=Candidatus Nomurabacteria bacterium GW2011_GWA2_40_9 TaxID=1618734 RepID=A0A0G0TWM8_9BACT|nr:MAG: Periplasmic sensor signal transduction histidine kinase [Candidatus Nomurabacteria bacterium GW2011_GWA2_40_9]